MQGSQAGLGTTCGMCRLMEHPVCGLREEAARDRAGAGGPGAFRGFWEAWVEKAEPWSHSEALGGRIWGWGRRRENGTQV